MIARLYDLGPAFLVLCVFSAVSLVVGTIFLTLASQRRNL